MRRVLFALMLVLAAPANGQEAPAVAAPGIRLNEQGANEPGPPRMVLRPIEPANSLERIFLAASDQPEARPVFRRMLLDQNVALVMTSAEPGATPREIAIGNNRSAAFIFTSSERVDEVMGPETPRQVMTGRAAFERLRGKNVILNPRLMPMLTLEPEDLIAYLAAPVPRASAGPAQ
jgi:hypothetical protein